MGFLKMFSSTPTPGMPDLSLGDFKIMFLMTQTNGCWDNTVYYWVYNIREYNMVV